MKTSIAFALLVACMLGLSMAQFFPAVPAEPSTGFGSGNSKLMKSQFFGHSSVIAGFVQTFSLTSCIKPLLKILAKVEYCS